MSHVAYEACVHAQRMLFCACNPMLCPVRGISRYFYKSSRLLRRGVIKMPSSQFTRVTEVLPIAPTPPWRSSRRLARLQQLATACDNAARRCSAGGGWGGRPRAARSSVSLIEFNSFWRLTFAFFQLGCCGVHIKTMGGLQVDLMHQSVVLDRRILDWVVGLDTEISEIVEGSNLYKPTVNLEDVILEERQKRDILTAVTSFQQFKVRQLRHHFGRHFGRVSQLHPPYVPRASLYLAPMLIGC